MEVEIVHCARKSGTNSMRLVKDSIQRLLHALAEIDQLQLYLLMELRSPSTKCRLSQVPWPATRP